MCHMSRLESSENLQESPALRYHIINHVLALLSTIINAMCMEHSLLSETSVGSIDVIFPIYVQ